MRRSQGLTPGARLIGFTFGVACILLLLVAW